MLPSRRQRRLRGRLQVHPGVPVQDIVHGARDAGGSVHARHAIGLLKNLQLPRSQGDLRNSAVSGKTTCKVRQLQQREKC